MGGIQETIGGIQSPFLTDPKSTSVDIEEDRREFLPAMTPSWEQFRGHNDVKKQAILTFSLAGYRGRKDIC